MSNKSIGNDVGSSDCSCTDEQINALSKMPAGIHYSEDGSKAARHSTGVFFTLDPETKLPAPLDVGGLFRVHPEYPSWSLKPHHIQVDYRIERKFFKRFKSKWLSSRYVGSCVITVGNVREIEYEDILSMTLELSEKRKFQLKADSWMGDYPPKEALPVTDTEN